MKYILSSICKFLAASRSPGNGQLTRHRRRSIHTRLRVGFPRSLAFAEPARGPLVQARPVAGRRVFVLATSILLWLPTTPEPSSRRAMTTNVRTGLADLRKELESPKPDLERCKKLLVQLKIALTQLAGLQPGAELTADAVSELELARDVYETAVHLSILSEDIPSFERHVALVKTYYFDYASVMPPSPRAGHLLGLNLMRLIAQNRIAEFHTELELVPAELRMDSHVAYALRLEQQLTDGAYATILSNAADVPDTSFRFFMDTLCVTARKETADCAERAYEVLDKATLVRLLALEDPEEVDTLAMERGWVINGDTVRFGGDDAGEAAVDLELSVDLIKRNMEYAKELERIV